MTSVCICWDRVRGQERRRRIGCGTSSIFVLGAALQPTVLRQHDETGNHDDSRPICLPALQSPQSWRSRCKLYIYIYTHTHTHIVYATLHKIYIYSVLFFVLILSVHVIVSRSNNLPSAILFLPSNSLVVEPRLRLCIRNFKDPSLPSHHPRRVYLSLHGEPENRQKFPSF